MWNYEYLFRKILFNANCCFLCVLKFKCIIMICLVFWMHLAWLVLTIRKTSWLDCALIKISNGIKSLGKPKWGSKVIAIIIIKPKITCFVIYHYILINKLERGLGMIKSTLNADHYQFDVRNLKPLSSLIKGNIINLGSTDKHCSIDKNYEVPILQKWKHMGVIPVSDTDMGVIPVYKRYSIFF